MTSRSITLRFSLQAIVLATPLILFEGCSSGSTGGGSPYSCPGGTEVFPLDAGELEAGVDCESVCSARLGLDVTIERCVVEEPFDGGPGQVSCTGSLAGSCGLGRRSASLLASKASRPSSAVGEYFAEAARLEAAAVQAFRTMVGELEAHAAPARLLRAAGRSIAEERRHARVMRGFATRFGVVPHRARFGRTPPVRTLESIAIENAAEGCVRETYGAAVALWQGKHAQDHAVARAMARIAQDETRHAQLSWDLAAWAEHRLSPSGRARVEQARARALAELNVEIDRPVATTLVAIAGMPPRASARELLRRVECQVIAGVT